MVRISKMFDQHSDISILEIYIIAHHGTSALTFCLISQTL